MLGVSKSTVLRDAGPNGPKTTVAHEENQAVSEGVGPNGPKPSPLLAAIEKTGETEVITMAYRGYDSLVDGAGN